jgi:alpha-mannosidase
MQGTYAFRLALFPHAGSWQQACVWQQAHAVNAPLRGVQTGTHPGPLTTQGSFLRVGPTSQVPTAIKITEDETGWLVRAVNYGDAEADLRLISQFALASATVSDLAETADGAPVDLQPGRGPTCRARAITTIRMPLL